MPPQHLKTNDSLHPLVTGALVWFLALPAFLLPAGCSDGGGGNNLPRKDAVAGDRATNQTGQMTASGDPAPPPAMAATVTPEPAVAPEPPKAPPEPEKAVFPETGPLPEKWRAPFLALRQDPPPRRTIRGIHYWVSNEGAHHVWRKDIAGIGGALAGPGTDQLYVLAAWQRPTVMIPFDFDGMIPLVHRLYGLAFVKAPTPKEFIELWRHPYPKAPALKALIDEGGFDDQLRAQLHDVLLQSATKIHWRLKYLVGYYRHLGQTCFLNDAAEYAVVRNLWVEGRVFPVRGDLTADLAMQDLARVLDLAGVPLRVLYLSNAEQYFEYSPAFRRNIIVQPWDDRSVVVRTQPHKEDVVDDDMGYRFNLQPGPNFAAWMRQSSVKDLFAMMRFKTKTSQIGVSVLRRDPEPAKIPPRVAPAGEGFSFPTRLP